MPFDAAAREPFAYLTTTGRRTGVSREVEIWFALLAGSEEGRRAQEALVARHGHEVAPGDPWREAGLPVLVRV